MTKEALRQFLSDHWGRVLGGIAGLLIGLAIIIFGFWRSLFIFFCIALGIYLGRMLDRNEGLQSLIQRFWPDRD